MPEIAIYILVFVAGAAIGSFLNVVIHRLPNDLSLLPSSKCPKCDTAIRFYHNVPILGWLLLGGRCSSCKERISWRYPAVELLTALVFILIYWQVGLNAALPVALVFAAAIIALVFIDAEHMILPNVITYPLFVGALILRAAYPLLPAPFAEMFHFPAANLYAAGWPVWVASVGAALFGALVGGGSLWLVGAVWKVLRRVDAMGLGDVKLLLGIGALLGWRLAMLTIFIGAFTGALAGIVLVIKEKDKDLQTQIPFGIFLGIGSIVAMLFGSRIIEWYLGRF